MGWGYGVQQAKVTQSGGLENLSAYKKINVVDHYSDPAHNQARTPDQDDAPEMENKVVFNYNILTSQIFFWYYY